MCLATATFAEDLLKNHDLKAHPSSLQTVKRVQKSFYSSEYVFAVSTRVIEAVRRIEVDLAQKTSNRKFIVLGDLATVQFLHETCTAGSGYENGSKSQRQPSEKIKFYFSQTGIRE